MEQEVAMEIFTGLMLGDGNLTPTSERGNAYFRISRSDTKENRDYLLEIEEALKALGVNVSSDQPKSRVRTSRGKAAQVLDLDSRASPILTEQHHLWIVSNRPKRRKIPDHFAKIAPLALAYWFESDGSTTKIGENHVQLCLRSCQFGREGNLRLKELLKDIGIEIQLKRELDRRNNTEYWSLRTSRTSTVNRFLDIVEPHIHPPYTSKVKRPWLKQKITKAKR